MNVNAFAAQSSSMKRSAYDRDASKTRKDYMAIEDAFAKEIGKDAVEELQLVRARELGAFDRSGALLAPPTL